MASTYSFSEQEYKDSIEPKAEELLFKGFQETIAQINRILETPQFKNKNYIDVHQDLNIPIANAAHLELPPAKRLRSSTEDRTNVSIPINQHLVGLIEIIKPRMRKLVEDFNLLKMWIHFMIPKIEDGNNFGVKIQEETMAEIQSAGAKGREFFEHISSYFSARGKLISKVIKYPQLEDYRCAVQEFDENEFLMLCLDMEGIRNRYCRIHDIVVKNLEKIKKPRSTNAVELLY